MHVLHTVTADRFPPPGFVPASGGVFRDCGVHDFDALCWVTRDDVVSGYARGANRGAAYFAESGDVDTALAGLELGHVALSSVSLGRYDGAGSDARLEALRRPVGSVWSDALRAGRARPAARG